MVSLRCKMIVKEEFDKLGINDIVVSLGTVDILEEISTEKQQALKTNLLQFGLEVMDDKKAILIEKIKTVIIEMIHYGDEFRKENFSEHISRQLNYDYVYLSNIFSEVRGITIQQFIINHKIEKVKELLLYNELSLSEIALKMNYSSVGHLSNQFKKVTGLSPSYYKQLKEKRKANLENL